MKQINIVVLLAIVVLVFLIIFMPGMMCMLGLGLVGILALYVVFTQDLFKSRRW